MHTDTWNNLHRQSAESKSVVIGWESEVRAPKRRIQWSCGVLGQRKAFGSYCVFLDSQEWLEYVGLSPREVQSLHKEFPMAICHMGFGKYSKYLHIPTILVVMDSSHSLLISLLIMPQKPPNTYNLGRNSMKGTRDIAGGNMNIIQRTGKYVGIARGLGPL